MRPKSKCHAYVGFDDGSKAVKYYNTETKKVLMACNFWNLKNPKPATLPEEIKVTSNSLPEGEPRRSMPQIGAIGSDDQTQKTQANKQPLDDASGIDEPY